MMSIGPPLLPLLDEPQAATPRPSARAATTASPSRTKGGLIRLPSARPKGPPTGFERVAIKEFLPFSIGLVYKRSGRLADWDASASIAPAQTTRLGGSAPSRAASTLFATRTAIASRARVVAEPI